MKKNNFEGLSQFDKEYYGFTLIGLFVGFFVYFLSNNFILSSIWSFGTILLLYNMSISYELIRRQKK